MMRRVIAIAFLAIGIYGVCSTPNVDEDSPQWRCATMGNHQCGPETLKDR